MACYGCMFNLFMQFSVYVLHLRWQTHNPFGLLNNALEYTRSRFGIRSSSRCSQVQILQVCLHMKSRRGYTALSVLCSDKAVPCSSSEYSCGCVHMDLRFMMLYNVVIHTSESGNHTVFPNSSFTIIFCGGPRKGVGESILSVDFSIKQASSSYYCTSSLSLHPKVWSTKYHQAHSTSTIKRTSTNH